MTHQQMTHQPHHVGVPELATFFAEQVTVGASATTADGMQRKELVRKGDGTYVVRRKYLVDPLIDQEWWAAYEGLFLETAVTEYNRLS